MSLLAFFGLVIVISLSGVLLPGPMTATTVAKSYSDRWAGAKVAVGHAVVEMPLLAVIAMGAFKFLTDDSPAIVFIGLVGGGYLLLFGVALLRDERFITRTTEEERITRNSFVLGMTTTLFNPGFFVWWATIGVFLVTEAIRYSLEYSIAVLILFGSVHWLCDLGWGFAISLSIQKVKQFYASRLEDIIRWGCAAIILLFGGFFAAKYGHMLLFG